MKRVTWSTLNAVERDAVLARPQQRNDPAVSDTVRRIFDDVALEGETAVARWAERLDNAAPKRLELTSARVDAARAELDAADLAALELAVSNVRRFHEATKPKDEEIEVISGVRCKRLWRPIASCGLYIPGGSAPLFSTLIMLAEPARVAGVRERIAVTPPGGLHPMMVVAAAACGLDVLWVVGGAQAIAALTFGAGMPKAYKIFGPGNAYVTEAKRHAAATPGGPAIDVPAGPSELMVIADACADAEIVAADLLSQAEHDPYAQVLLVALSDELVERVSQALERQCASLPRAKIAQTALSQARAILVRDASEAAEVANLYAPEHLSLQVADASVLVAAIDNAGAIFVGRFSAETFGDYICGPSHVLPTDGAARTWSGVSVLSFMKSFTVQTMDEVGARALAPGAARLARLEGLEAHARAADARLS
jgi:histidinol dehydrogenase